MAREEEEKSLYGPRTTRIAAFEPTRRALLEQSGISPNAPETNSSVETRGNDDAVETLNKMTDKTDNRFGMKDPSGTREPVAQGPIRPSSYGANIPEFSYPGRIKKVKGLQPDSLGGDRLMTDPLIEYDPLVGNDVGSFYEELGRTATGAEATMIMEQGSKFQEADERLVAALKEYDQQFTRDFNKAVAESEAYIGTDGKHPFAKGRVREGEEELEKQKAEAIATFDKKYGEGLAQLLDIRRRWMEIVGGRKKNPQTISVNTSILE